MSISTLLQKLLPSFKDTLLRFPLSCLAAFALATLIFPSFKLDKLFSDENYGKSIYIASIGVLWFTSVQIFAESRNWSAAKATGLALIPWGLLAAILFTSHNQAVIPLILLSVGVALIPIYAPYIGKKVTDCIFWRYNFELGSSLCFATISTIILCGGLSIGLVAIDRLFGVDIRWKIYADIWVLGWTVYGIIYFLAGVPRDFISSTETDNREFPKAVRIIVTYMLVPLTLAYMGILYAYYAKILFTATLPKGILSNLTIAFCSVGIVSWLISLPLAESGAKPIRIFCRHFFKVLLIPAAVLAFAIGIRISEYGVTESRYVMVMAALWFGLCSAFYWRWEQHSIKFIPVSISVMFMLASFGPWSADNISINSQLKRFKQFIETHKMLDNQGFLRKSESELNKEDSKNIDSMISYLMGNKVRANNIAHYFPAKHEIHAEIKKQDFKSWEVQKKLRLDLGIRRYSYNNEGKVSLYNTKNTPVNVAGYNHLIRFNIYRTSNRKISPAFKIDEKEYWLNFNEANINLTNKSGDILSSFEIQTKIDKLSQLYKKNYQAVLKSDNNLLWFNNNSNQPKVKIIFNNITLEAGNNLNPNSTTSIKQGNGYILFEELPK